MINNLNYSYEFTNNERHMTQAFETVRQFYPTFLSQLKYDPNVIVTNHKHEWIEAKIGPTTTVITQDITDSDTDLPVESSEGFETGALLRFEGSDLTSRDEVAKITSVSGNTLTLQRGYGGTTPVALYANDVCLLNSKPIKAKSDVTLKGAYGDDVAYNYTEIIDDSYSLSRSQINSKAYGYANGDAQLLEQRTRMLESINYQLAGAVIYGRKEQRDVSNEDTGSMGGILQMIENGNVVNAQGAMSQDLLNGVIRDIFGKGGMRSSVALLCSEHQQAKFSNMNSITATNSPVQTRQDDTRLGGYISTFQSSLFANNGSVQGQIIVDPTFPKDKLAILDMSKIELRCLQPMHTEDARLNKSSNYEAERVLGEFTLECKNADVSHGLITNLEI